MEKEYLIGLDRDGTIIKDIGYLGKDENWKEQINFCENALEGLRLLRQQANFKIVTASNQAGVARGFLSIDKMHEVNRYIMEKLKQEGIELDGSYCCPFANKEYAVENNIPEKCPWVKESKYRKPKIGMLETAAKNLGQNLQDFSKIYFIGDKKIDVETGINANGKGILTENEKYPQDIIDVLKMQKLNTERIFVVKDFLQAASVIISDIEKTDNCNTILPVFSNG